MNRTDLRPRVLGIADSDLILEGLDTDPVTDVFLDSRLRPQLAAGRLSDTVMGFRAPDRSVSLCWLGANVVPTANTTADAAVAYAEHVRSTGMWFSSLWGPRQPVTQMWDHLRGDVRAPRAIRDPQQFMSLTGDALVPPDPDIVRIGPGHFDAYYAASVEFSIEELGSSPEAFGGGSYYRARVRSLIEAGHAFGRFEDGELVAKADLALVTTSATQVQGVWVRRRNRGRGLAAPVVSAACAVARAEIAPTVTLYVNDFNVAARRTYTRLGFVETAEFMTLLW